MCIIDYNNNTIFLCVCVIRCRDWATPHAVESCNLEHVVGVRSEVIDTSLSNDAGDICHMIQLG